MNADATPAASGFRMPAEWEPHERCWMMWPCRRSVWPDMAATCRAYANVAHAIRRFEPVSMICPPADAAEARRLLGSDVEIVEWPIDDSWSRDAGACYLVDDRGALGGVDFRFNAWGGKYAPFDQDDAVAERMIEFAGARRFRSALVAEGGGISVDGEGTILTTESCFPNANRNPGWSRSRIERELMDMLGGRKVIWLPGDPDERETDGHVDGIAVFVGPATVLIERADTTLDRYAATQRANVEALSGRHDAAGRPIKLVEIPYADEAAAPNDIFCGSYVNLYIANGGIVMPLFDVESDDIAREIIEAVFPEHEVTGVRIDDIAVGGGGIHCITQQEPATAPAGR